MNKILAPIVLGILLLSFLLVAPLKPADATTVFADNFSEGNFSRWSKSYVISGADQLVTDGVARFIVPPPAAGTSTYSYVVKDDFTSTANTTIVASQDVLVTNVPSGSTQGNGAIFFLYICDSSDLHGNCGNIGVGIDGSTVWSLWIGGSEEYRYVFQSSGPAPLSNTWYHLVLTINNAAQTVSLEVNGIVVIAASQQQFIDKTHPVTLMSGLGENWWSNGAGQLELRVDNVQLDISDMSVLPVPAASTPPQAQMTMPTQPPTPVTTQTPTQTPTATATPSPTPPPLPISSFIQPEIALDLTVAQGAILAVLLVLLAAMLWHKR